MHVKEMRNISLPEAHEDTLLFLSSVKRDLQFVRGPDYAHQHHTHTLHCVQWNLRLHTPFTCGNLMFTHKQHLCQAWCARQLSDHRRALKCFQQPITKADYIQQFRLATCFNCVFSSKLKN